MTTVFRQKLFCGKAALVTGGGTGIGFAIAKELASLGCNVCIASRNTENLRAAADRIKDELTAEGLQLQGIIHVVSCNLKQPDSIAQCVADSIAAFGRLDYLVNNAGGQFLSSAEDISANGFEAVVKTNLTGTFLMCKEAYNQWMCEHGGSIVSISVSCSNGYTGMAHSGAARAGVENLTKTLSLEWISSNVRINCCAPGVIYTDSGAKNYGASADELMPKILQTIPAKRCGTANEVSSCVIYLLSDAASYITGITIDISGGYGLTYMTPLVNIKDTMNLTPYGHLNPKARL